MAETQLKIPYPRQLTKNETLDSLSHWQTSVRNYFRRSTQFQEFFRRTAKWDCSAENYGLTGDNVEDRADNLESLLDTLSSFLPGPYITHKITKTTTSIASVWNIIWDHYDVTPSQSTFLDFYEISMSSDDRPMDLYDKMIYHALNHLCPAGTDGGEQGGGKLEVADVLTLSHRNLIALNWLHRLHPGLVSVIKMDYSKDLKKGVPLSSLVKTFAENMPSLLAKAKSAPTASSDKQLPSYDQSTVCRVFNPSFQPGHRFNVRGRGQVFGSRPPFNQTRPQRPTFPSNNMHCQSCFSLGKKLSLKVDFKHTAKFCPQLANVRSVTSDASDLQLDDQLSNIQEDDQAYDEDQVQLEGKPDSTFFPPTSPWHSKINSVKKIENRVQHNGILKAKSPSAKVKIFQTDTYCIIDEGSELCCIDHSLAKSINIPFSRTTESAVGAGSSTMILVGETDASVVLSLPYCKYPIHWNLGKCVVVQNLGCPILIGEPGKLYNNILTDPTKRLISTRNVNGQRVSFPYHKQPTITQSSFLVRSNLDEVIYPNDYVSVPVPAMFSESQTLFFTPRRHLSSNAPSSQVCKVTEGQVKLYNKSDCPILVKKRSHYGDIFSDVAVTPVKSSRPPNHNLQTKSKDNPSPAASPSYVSDTKVDPDNMLDSAWKSHFSDMLHQFSDIINPNPGQYNNF